MNKWLRVGVFVLTLFVTHMLLGMFERYSFVTAIYDIALGNPKVVYFGETDENEADYVKAATVIGFEYKRIAGCNVYTSLVNGAKGYNAVTGFYLSKKYGADWKNKWQTLAQNQRFQILKN